MLRNLDLQSLSPWAFQGGGGRPGKSGCLRLMMRNVRTAELLTGYMTPLNQQSPTGWTSPDSRRPRRRHQLKPCRGRRRDSVFDHRECPPEMGFKVIAPGFTVPFGPDVVLPTGLSETEFTEETGISNIKITTLDLSRWSTRADSFAGTAPPVSFLTRALSSVTLIFCCFSMSPLES